MPVTASAAKLAIDGASPFDLGSLEAVARQHCVVALADAARERVLAARRVVDDAVARGGRRVYGVNTGFGNFADVHVPPDDLPRTSGEPAALPRGGVGEPFPRRCVRAMILLRANVLARGYSGCARRRSSACSRCSTPASTRSCRRRARWGERRSRAARPPRPGADRRGRGVVGGRGAARRRGAARAGLAPLDPRAEGGPRADQRHAGHDGDRQRSRVAEAGASLDAADVVGALSLDALLGTDVAFDERIHARAAAPGPGRGARAADAACSRAAALRESHRDCGRVQDAYSLRCMPQVHGAARDALGYVRRVLDDRDQHRHRQPDGLRGDGRARVGRQLPRRSRSRVAFDFLAIARGATSASISERRIERLVNPALSRPARRSSRRDAGLNSGLMMAHVTAAALVSREQGRWPTPRASTPSRPRPARKTTSRWADRRAEGRASVENTARVLAVELLAAARRSTSTARSARRPPRGRRAAVRGHVPHLEQDRVLAPEIEARAELVLSGAVEAAVASAGATLE